MPNMDPKKNPMPSQAAEVRKHNFQEVALGYSQEAACQEAQRCLQCKHKPCVKGCPVAIEIPDFIKEVEQGNYQEAYEVIAQSSSLPAVCGRVCPQENQCEKNCVRGIKGEPVGIGRLERFVADWYNAQPEKKRNKPKSNGHKVAVVGSGPAGLACAGELAGLGYEVTIFEALHLAGGVLMYGIPEFRLPKEIVQKEIQGLKDMGVEIQTNMVIGRIFSIDQLMEDGFEAVFIGTGAGLPRFMNIPGENLKGVYSANEFLTRVNLMRAYEAGKSDTPVQMAKRVAVVGGGNVAMDAARSALRLGAEEVTIVYRRGEKELPARAEEVEHAMEEGIRFEFLTNPIQLKGEEGWVSGMVCQRMALSDADESGRARAIPIEGSEFELAVDCVIMSIGTSPNPLIKSTTKGLDTQKWGGIVVEEETGHTSRDGVYAGGDAVTGAATVILAMGAGKSAAKAIDQKIKQK